MNATFSIHLEPTDTDVVWWAESDDLPGFSGAASTLRELRGLIEEAVRLHLADEAEIALELVAEPLSSNPEGLGQLEGVPEADLRSYGPSVRLATAFQHAA
jgi:predicted RNase H-like HicB family nuclease